MEVLLPVNTGNEVNFAHLGVFAGCRCFVCGTASSPVNTGNAAYFAGLGFFTYVRQFRQRRSSIAFDHRQRGGFCRSWVFLPVAGVLYVAPHLRL